MNRIDLRLFVVFAPLFAVGCSETISLCEIQAEGVTYCVDTVGDKYCKNELGGEATKSASSSDPNCESEGYVESCPDYGYDAGDITGTLTGTFESFGVNVKSVEDCDTLMESQGGTTTTGS